MHFIVNISLLNLNAFARPSFLSLRAIAAIISTPVMAAINILLFDLELNSPKTQAEPTSFT